MKPLVLAFAGLVAALIGLPQAAVAGGHGGFGVPLYNHPPALVGPWSEVGYVAPAAPVFYGGWTYARPACSCCGCGSRWGYASVTPAPVYGYRTYAHPHVWGRPAYGYARPLLRPRPVVRARIDVAPRYFPSNRVAPLRAERRVMRERTVRIPSSGAVSAGTSTRTLVRIR